MNGMFRISRSTVFAPDDGAGGGGSAGGAGAAGSGAAGAAGTGKGNEGQQPALTYEAWLATQPENIKALVTGNEHGLKSALESEREEKKALVKELRDAAAKAEKGSEAETKLTAMADRVVESDRKASFYEQGLAAGVNNLRLAYIAAKTDDLFKKNGEADFEALKKAYPELFGRTKPKNGAGEGTNEEPPKGKDGMNSFIRKSAGRTTE